MNRPRFVGKTVVITGGAQGMGEAHARGFHAEGAKVVVLDVNAEKGAAVVAALGENALFLTVDVRQETAWSAAISAIESRFGAIAVLINNAAIVEPAAPIKDMALDVWKTTIDVNLTGAFLGIRAVASSMTQGGGGSIVNISSTGGFMGSPLHGAYTASKWGLRGLTKTAALELGRYNIRVNTVHPGFTNSPMLSAAGRVPEAALKFAIPRPAEPEEMTRMVMFVASDEASFSTGSEFIVDGGFLLSVGTAHDANEPYN